MGSRIEGDVYVNGTLQAKTVNLPEGAVDNAAVKSGAGLEATKLEHQHAIAYQQADGSDVVAAIVPIHTVRGATGTIVAIEVACVDAPSGGDKQLTVDLKKANQGSPTPATVLSAVITIDSTKADMQVVAGTISSASLADGDTLLVEVAVSGSTGSQGQGLIVTVTIREDAQ